MSCLTAARQIVVLREVARLGAALGDGALELLCGLFGHVFIEPAGVCPSDQDALDRGVFEGAKEQRVGKRGEQVSGVVAFAQGQHPARVIASRAVLVFFERGEKGGRWITKIGKGAAQLVEIRPVLGVARAVPIENGSALGTARQERVARDTGQVGLVDEQLVLGNAHREDLGDVLVGKRVPNSFPRDEALDVAQLVEHAGGVEWVARQR